MMDWTLTLSVDVTLNLLFVFLFFLLTIRLLRYDVVWGVGSSLSSLCLSCARVRLVYAVG